MNQLIAINKFCKKLNQFQCIDSFEVKEKDGVAYYLYFVINLNSSHSCIFKKETDKLFELLKSFSIRYEYKMIKR
jgi:hypothetical protein